MCRTCNVGQRPDCVLCPNKGGAMKSTRSGQKWAHVSCALWIPEVSIGSVDRMEPITKISSIPQSRWALLCVLCRERVGACIQCSVKTCKTAYHVTCAFQHGLEMRAIIEDEHAEDGVKLRSYCLKHSMNKSKRDKSGNSCGGNNANASGSEDDDVKRKKQRKDMTTEERNQARIQRLQEVEADFDKHVNVKDISCHLLEVDQEGIHGIYNYWILKRKSMNNRPLLPPKSEDVDMASHKQGQADVEKMKMFVHLRQDLERVRNLCYMVSRREKLSRSFFKMREQTFHKQVTLLTDMKVKKVDESMVQAVLQANHGPSIYDRLYSARQVTVPNQEKWDQLVQRLAECVNMEVDEVKAKNTDLNGVNQKRHQKSTKKTVFNGAAARRASTYVSSLSSDSESSTGRMIREISSVKKTPKTAEGTKIDRRKRRVNSSAAAKSKNLVDTSSEEDDGGQEKQRSPRNRTLRQMAREMSNDKSRLSSNSDESDELLPIRNSSGQEARGKMSAIYSDSDSTDKDKTDNGASDSQQHVVRTKAAMKEFVPQKSTKATVDSKSSDAPVHKTREKKGGKTAKQDTSNKTNNSKSVSNKKTFNTDLLVVPQRQAAKKASENMKSTAQTAPAAVAKKEMPPSKGAPAPAAAEAEVKERRDSLMSPSKEKVSKGKPPKSSQTSTTPKGKEKSAEAENRELLEKLAYVPQRQAAKKAAEHIKSGLGKPTEAPAAAAAAPPAEEQSKPTKSQTAPATKKSVDDTKKNATPVVISSSSSSYTGSSSSSSSTSSSSSDTEEEVTKTTSSKKSTAPPPPKETKAGPVNNRTRDLPFLDKDTKSLRSVSTSDSSGTESESSDESSESTSNNNNRNSTKKATTGPSKKSEGNAKASGGDSGKAAAGNANASEAKKADGGGKAGDKESMAKVEEKSKKVDSKETDSSATTKGCPTLPLNKDCEVR
uniref:Uncharacterized protein n=1 Tax=Phlebotomus papatasi TaxID=29031 RepID=A0A1B0D742_PHLPP